MSTADDIEALPWRTPTLVLELLGEGEMPRSVVLGLISDAMLVAEGKIPDLLTLVGLVTEAENEAGEDPDLLETWRPVSGLRRWIRPVQRWTCWRTCSSVYVPAGSSSWSTQMRPVPTTVTEQPVALGPARTL